MSNRQIALNLVPNEPHLSDLLDLLKKEILLGLQCHHIGKIQSFNSTAQTVVATINYTKTFFQLNTVTGQYNPVQISYPTVIDCPIIILGGGTSHLTMPIAAGNECLLLFNDRDMDNWYQSGQFGPVGSSRLHSFSDAICLVGLNSTPNALSAYDAVRALLTNGNVSVGINPSNNKATIKNNASGTLNTVLQNILTQLQNLCTACAAITVSGVQTGAGVSAVPVNASTITSIGSNLSTQATTLWGVTRMSTRALDANGDWVFGTGLNAYVTGNAEVAQNIKTRLSSFLNDCFFDTGAGVNWFYLLGSKNQSALNLAIGTVILNTANVTGGLQLSVTYNAQTRNVSIVYNVTTTYSQLSNSFNYDLSVV